MHLFSSPALKGTSDEESSRLSGPESRRLCGMQTRRMHISFLSTQLSRKKKKKRRGRGRKVKKKAADATFGIQQLLWRSGFWGRLLRVKMSLQEKAARSAQPRTPTVSVSVSFWTEPAFLIKRKKWLFNWLFFSSIVLIRSFAWSKNNVYEPADGGNSRSDPTCQILLSPLKSNSWRGLHCFVGLTLGEGKKTASESKATAHPTVSMNYLGSRTSVIQKAFFPVHSRPSNWKQRLVSISRKGSAALGVNWFLSLSLPQWMCCDSGTVRHRASWKLFVLLLLWKLSSLGCNQDSYVMWCVFVWKNESIGINHLKKNLIFYVAKNWNRFAFVWICMDIAWMQIWKQPNGGKTYTDPLWQVCVSMCLGTLLQRIRNPESAPVLGNSDVFLGSELC